jgi:peptide chain release factor
MIWLQLTSGRGPEECNLAVAGLLNVILDEAKAVNLECDVLETEDSEHGYRSALVSVQGEAEETFAQSWKGTVRWICQSPIRKEHRRKNWFLGISVLTPPTQAETIHESDLKYESMRASGPGGQNVNKTETKIKLTHLPTGIAVTSQEERSQHRNKALALAKLTRIMNEAKTVAEADALQDRWSKHDELQRGGEIRIYTGLDFKRKV